MGASRSPPADRGVRDSLPPVVNGRKLHFVGIGGAGMSGLALIAHQLGASVTGSDRAAGGPYIQRLRAAGIEPAVGHAASNVPDGAEVVYSTAVGPENPERREPELHRADFLAELTTLKPAICISGTHGKTTTTSMVVHALLALGLDPAYSVGGEVRTTGTNAAWGDGPWFVVEADESDRSLLKLHPRIAVVTNAELDHHATYGSLRDVLETFAEFTGKAERVVVPEALREALGGVAYERSDVDLSVPGEHNRLNAGAALKALELAGVDVDAAGASLRDFIGAGRRFEELGVTASGARVVDDYAHHPTEVAATIAAAREQAPRRVVAVFQPHLFSRTEAEATGFGRALAAADLPVVTGIYPARERQEDFPGVTGLRVAEAAADAGAPVVWMPTLEDAERFLTPRLRAGDLVLTLGAGNVDGLGHRLLAT